jgi:hypothetical protein
MLDNKFVGTLARKLLIQATSQHFEFSEQARRTFSSPTKRLCRTGTN